MPETPNTSQATNKKMTPDSAKINNGTKIKTTHYDNGKVQSKTHYMDGKEHGVDTWWDEDGKKQWETMWRDGKQHGMNTGWYDDGPKCWEIYNIHGKEYARIDWDEKGIVTEIDFPRPSIIKPTVKSKKSDQRTAKLPFV